MSLDFFFTADEVSHPSLLTFLCALKRSKRYEYAFSINAKTLWNGEFTFLPLQTNKWRDFAVFINTDFIPQRQFVASVVKKVRLDLRTLLGACLMLQMSIYATKQNRRTSSNDPFRKWYFISISPLFYQKHHWYELPKTYMQKRRFKQKMDNDFCGHPLRLSMIWKSISALRINSKRDDVLIKKKCVYSISKSPFWTLFWTLLTQFVAEFGRRAVKEFTSTTLGGKETTSNLVYISLQRRQTCRQQLLSTGTCCVQSRKGASTSLFHPRQRHPTRQENSRHQRQHAPQRQNILLTAKPLAM